MRKSQPGAFSLRLVDRKGVNLCKRYAVLLTGPVGSRGMLIAQARTRERAWGLAMGALSDARARATNHWDKEARAELEVRSLALEYSTSGIILPGTTNPGTDPFQKAKEQQHGNS